MPLRTETLNQRKATDDNLAKPLKPAIIKAGFNKHLFF